MNTLIDNIEKLTLAQECKEIKSKKICVDPECETRSNFNFEGEPSALYCKKHKKPDMIDVNNKRCRHPNCKMYPIFNFEGIKPALYCNEHKKEDMVNIVNKRCIRPNCKIFATFNFENEKSPLYCAEHKKKNMVNVKGKTCMDPNCKRVPSFNFENEKIGIYCGKHKKNNMINVAKNKCIHPDCITLPSFNYKGEKTLLYCSEHKLKDMIDLKHTYCAHPDCAIQPNFNIEGEKKGLYCYTHRKDNMINVISRQCKSEWCYTLIGKKYDGYCVNCYIHLFPDKPNSRNYKTKETATIDYIKLHFPNFDWIFDKTIADGCSKRRPDAILDLGYHVIIVEVDENQHTEYDCSCENKRLMEISKDFGHRPIIFIRFNPDKYVVGKKQIKSCWGMDGHGKCVVKQKKNWEQRLETVITQIKYWSNKENITEKTIEIIELFYDQ